MSTLTRTQKILFLMIFHRTYTFMLDLYPAILPLLRSLFRVAMTFASGAVNNCADPYFKLLAQRAHTTR